MTPNATATIEIAPALPTSPEGNCIVCDDPARAIVVLDIGEPVCAECWCRNCGTAHVSNEPCYFEQHLIDPFEDR